MNADHQEQHCISSRKNIHKPFWKMILEATEIENSELQHLPNILKYSDTYCQWRKFQLINIAKNNKFQNRNFASFKLSPSWHLHWCRPSCLNFHMLPNWTFPRWDHLWPASFQKPFLVLRWGEYQTFRWVFYWQCSRCCSVLRYLHWRYFRTPTLRYLQPTLSIILQYLASRSCALHSLTDITWFSCLDCFTLFLLLHLIFI